ncbi:hypothetical protein DIZ27_42480 [Streptomyces sp. NWU339]|uniref:DUF6248 family natural product biosynthesis protein n=1 Tax=Streptomyces sp. NWU339 TaxID=2185284 RepID=UPI000D675709|nr:DUF6248 family natural product biosynthesis protein [Streptomyces sp. NWU339]PWI04917.1 hypothetical protein DIZ27_42480 [Streptomyces sp. NWU339]
MTTTWLRYVGASIMGILGPVPSTMTEEEGAWVRANAWTKALRKIDDAYPHGFHRWCSCEAGTCHPCRTGHHDQCISRNGPHVDDAAGTITDRGGFVVAVIRYGPGQQPCRWICRCTHALDGEAEEANAVDAHEVQPTARRSTTRCSKSVPAPAPDGQMSLFTSAGLPEEATGGETP